MSLLVTLDTAPDFAPEPGKPLPEKRVSGDPHFNTWMLDQSQGERIQTGIWEATPGETRAIRGHTYEYCHILSGVVELIEAGAAPVRYEAGSQFVIKPGFNGIWRTVETVRKIFVIVD